MRATSGSVTGTKIILLEGGPPEWDGHVAGVSKTGGGQAERWDHTADLPLVYERTDRMAPVEIVRHRKGGDVTETKQAEIYACRGYRDEIPRPGDAPAQLALDDEGTYKEGT